MPHKGIDVVLFAPDDAKATQTADPNRKKIKLHAGHHPRPRRPPDDSKAGSPCSRAGHHPQEEDQAPASTSFHLLSLPLPYLSKGTNLSASSVDSDFSLLLVLQ
uniref:Uncharacterized protein n=1 Tax=Zea mays TaxID=4577 RepID=A0A804LLY8_MAIZE